MRAGSGSAEDRESGSGPAGSSTSDGFEVVCEIEPPTRPDLVHVRHQIGVLSKVASAYLIPDNHLGRATVSSVAVAHEVAAMGGRSIACLNGRDRNRLGLRRDLLTAAAYGVDQFLLVAGDPAPGERRGLGVRTMIEEIRDFGSSDAFDGRPRFRLGATTRLGPLAPFKQAADFLFVQVSFDVDGLLHWREGLRFDGPVYAGVMVLASPSMAARIARDIPEVAIPAAVLERLDAEPRSGVELACRQVEAIRDSGAFDGVHLVPVSRYREVAARLEQPGTR